MGLDFSCGERAEVGGRDLEKGNPDTLVGLLSNCVCTMCLYWALLHTTVAAVESISFGSIHHYNYYYVVLKGVN